MKNGIYKMLDGNWSNDSKGVIENLESEVKQLQKFLVSLIMHLVERNMITVADIEKNFDDGWRLMTKF